MKITAIESQKKALETTLYTPTEPKDCDSIPQSELILKNIDMEWYNINRVDKHPKIWYNKSERGKENVKVQQRI